MLYQNIVLFDFQDDWKNLLPITATRAIADIRIGILTIKEKWQKLFETDIQILTQVYLKEKYAFENKTTSLMINAKVLPNSTFVLEIEKLKLNEALFYQDTLIAFISENQITSNESILKEVAHLKKIQTNSNPTQINYVWDIFRNNGFEIKQDISYLKLKPNPDALSKTNTFFGNNIYVLDNVYCEASILNSNDGPIFLGEKSEVMEGCTIRAPFALCNNSTLKMQAKIYGDTTIGPHSKVGGEVSNSVFFGYSNKAHDGFLGNAVIGEWCNLGADTNNSNLKNNYSAIKVWNYNQEDYINSNLQFSGLIMGDHAKAAINTQFNTGTVVGVCANVIDAGFSAKFIPDFSWGNQATFSIEKAYEVAQRVMERRTINLSEIDRKILLHIFEQTSKYRKH
jgi:UDP-N-acetylglucosamine diphosphorylase/glucosamine-1-phosphate N-acetyltransferase